MDGGGAAAAAAAMAAAMSSRQARGEVIAEPGIEPGASAEPMLLTTDSFDELEPEMDAGLQAAPVTPAPDLDKVPLAALDSGDVVRAPLCFARVPGVLLLENPIC